MQNVTWERNGKDMGVVLHKTTSGVSEVQLGYLQYDGRVVINWTFILNGESFTETSYYDVVTPLLTDREVKEIHPNATDYEVRRIEAATRHIIQAHTGQRFGRFKGIYTVRGNDSRKLELPARLLELNSVNELQDSVEKYFAVEQGGWVLRHFPWGVPPVKADYYELHQHVGGVIHNPNNVRLGEFYKEYHFDVDGVWGYHEVPDPVKEAARLLVNDYACADSQYRDRYLTSMTAADWRIQFHEGAFARTGNVRADQLLADYVLSHGWAVV
jgi:hypothetical protein